MLDHRPLGFGGGEEGLLEPSRSRRVCMDFCDARSRQTLLLSVSEEQHPRVFGVEKPQPAGYNRRDERLHLFPNSSRPLWSPAGRPRGDPGWGRSSLCSFLHCTVNICLHSRAIWLKCIGELHVLRECFGRGPKSAQIGDPAVHRLAGVQGGEPTQRERGRSRCRLEELLERSTPLLGRIAAGRGLEAVAVGDEAYSLAAELLLPGSGRHRYLLRVVGQSMTEARIEDGDLLVVEEDEDPPDGAVVVALLKGEEATVKRLRREGETVRLRSQNGGYEDIVVPAEDVKVQGRVVYVVHPPSNSLGH